LSRQGSRAYSLLGHDIKVLDNLDRLDDLNDVDAVINLAGEPIAAGRWSESRKQLLCDSRWLLTEQLVDLIKLSTTPPKVLINASAIGWYGSTPPPSAGMADRAPKPSTSSAALPTTSSPTNSANSGRPWHWKHKASRPGSVSCGSGWCSAWMGERYPKCSPHTDSDSAAPWGRAAR